MKSTAPFIHYCCIILLTNFFGAFGCQFLPDQTVPTKSMSLDRSIKSAYSHRSSLQAQRQAIKQREHFARAELMGYLPQLNLRAAFFASGNQFSNHKRFIFDATQLLFSLSGPLQRYRVETESTHVERWAEALQRDQIRFDTEQNYLQLWLAQQKKPPIDATAQAAHYTIEKARAQATVGQISEPEFVTQQAAYTQQWTTVFNYDFELQQALLTLQDTLEMPFEFALDTNSVTYLIAQALDNAQTYSLEDLLVQAALNRKELPIFEAQIKREEYLKKLFYGSYFPTASLFVALIKDDIGTAIFDTSLFWNVGIRFNWAFDGLSDNQRGQAAEAAELQKKLERQNNMLVIRQEVQTAFHELQRLLNDVKNAEKQLEQATRLFQAQKKQYEVGDSATPDFVNAQQVLEQAEFNLTQAQIAATIKHQELLFKTGYPDDPPLLTTEKSLGIGIINEK